MDNNQYLVLQLVKFYLVNQLYRLIEDTENFQEWYTYDITLIKIHIAENE